MEEKKEQLFGISCDRESHIYHVGEYAAFTITSVRPGTEAEAVFTADGEAELTGLVVDGVHGDQFAQRAAEKGQKEQVGLGHAALALAGGPLVLDGGEGRKQVKEGEPDREDEIGIHGVSSVNACRQAGQTRIFRSWKGTTRIYLT